MRSLYSESTSDDPPDATRVPTKTDFNFSTLEERAKNEMNSAQQPLGVEKKPGLSFGFSTPSLGLGGPAFGGKPLSFGTPSATQTSSNVFGARPSFGSPGSFSVGRPSLSPQPPRSTPTVRVPQLMGDDTLSRATLRATQKRSALFGRQDVWADGLIARSLDNLDGSPDINDLITDLVGVAKDHPVAMKFLQYVFDEATRQKGAIPALAPLSSSTKPHGQTKSQAELELRLYFAFRRTRSRMWSKDLCDYIVRMVVYGSTPREIRAAIKEDMNWTHGRNHVPDKQVEDFVEWIRGDSMAALVEETRFTGSALDFFRPSRREEKKLGKVPKGGRLTHSAWSGGMADDGAVTCCAHKQPAKTNARSLVAGRVATSGTLDSPDVVAARKVRVFRFMDLPPEMRDSVYKYALVPTGYLSLRSCAHHMPTGVLPPVPASIFRVSKDTYKESTELHLANTIIVNACLESGIRPAIHRKQLPEHILPLIKSLVLVIDFTRITTHGARTADLRVAQGLTGLKKLRICGIATSDPHLALEEQLRVYLGIIAERVPAACEIVFGEEGEEAVVEHMVDMVEKIKAEDAFVSSNLPLKDAYAMGGSRLESVWKSIEMEVERGCKNGAKEDFRFEERRAKAEAEQWNEMRQRWQEEQSEGVESEEVQDKE